MAEAGIGRAVRWARKRAGMTQHDLARATGMPQPSIARIERGAVSPRTSTLTEILAASGHRLAVEPIGPEVDREELRRRMAEAASRRTRDALGSAARDSRTSPVRILRRLRRFGVPFVLIGDLAEVAHGAPMKLGRTIEICHAQTDVARERLRQALEDLGATASNGSDVKTDAGRLRILTETAAGDDYEILARNAVGMRVDAGLLVRVAAVEDLARARLARGTAEDQAAAAVLRAIADELAGQLARQRRRRGAGD